VQEEIGVLGMKPIGSGWILQSNTVSAPDCLRYALSLPTSVVITGCDSLETVNQALEVARIFQPLDATQVEALLAKTAPVAAEGKFEGYKTTHTFDGTIQNPQWLG